MQNSELFTVVENNKDSLKINNAKVSFTTFTECQVRGQNYTCVIIDNIHLFDERKLYTLRQILYPIISFTKCKLMYSTGPENNKAFWLGEHPTSARWWEMPRIINGKYDPFGWKYEMILTLGTKNFKESYGND